ncbi:MAG: FAD-binding protein [Clostridia bacterium]|nr:FAD-binding protein [Clostridia bacterium]
MKILVCAKVIKGEINPFDESALECALQLSDDVTVISMGPKSSENVLQPLTRLGTKAVLITDSLYAGSDTLATSYIMSTAIKQMEYDLILCGRQSIDGDTAQVGPMLSTRLGCGLITNALSIERTESGIKVKTRMGEEATSFPTLVTVERGYILRFPSIFSKLGKVEILDNSDLKCDESKCGLKGSPTRVLQTFENARGKRHCKFIDKTELRQLISELSGKEIAQKEKSEQRQKLKSVWAVGEEVLEKAQEIAEQVIFIEKTDVKDIVKKAMTEKPEVILWNADLWGRKNAPVAAAMLNTGLCADCTELDAEGDTLIMYRPAQGGRLYAKIKCLTYPQMATVRTKTQSSDIIVSIGRGASDDAERLKLFADEIGAEIAASRGLVDMGKAEYDLQVGLTGKTVSPKIYIAVGISGAVHHTCAIEGADTVIAVNPDREARIFEYSDYGVIASSDQII